MIHAVDQGNISAYEDQFKTVANALRERLAATTSADPLRPIYALPYDAPEFSYSLSLFADGSIHHCIQMFKVPQCPTPAPGAERGSTPREVWMLALLEGIPRRRPASDKVLLETFIGALELLTDLGARCARCRPDLIQRIGTHRVGAITRMGAEDGGVGLKLDRKGLAGLAAAAGLEQPIGYHVDPEEVSALQSLSAVEQMFSDLRERLSSESGAAPSQLR